MSAFGRKHHRSVKLHKINFVILNKLMREDFCQGGLIEYLISSNKTPLSIDDCIQLL